MAQIGRTGFARRQGLRPLGAHAVQHRMRHAGFAGRRDRAMSKCEPIRIRVGASCSPTSENRNSISSASPRRHVDPPCRKVALFARSAIRTGKTHVDMPASITWIVRMRKTHGEGAKTIARAPAPLADQMIERGMENGRIDSILEWLLPVSRSPVRDLFC
jgi:hypothetical protein